MTDSIIVVGAGISGLAAAHRVTELAPNCQLSLLEAGPRAGGLIRTETIHVQGAGDFLVEQGPDSIISDKPAALQLAKRLGLDEQILPTNSEDRGAFVVHRGKLERIPEGFSMMAPSKALPILRSPVLSVRGKLRMMAEVFIPRPRHVPEDESTASFVERRFGAEVLERLAQPLMGGIYGTSLDALSLSATMPRFVDLEREYRSVTLGLLAKQRQAARASRQPKAVTNGEFRHDADNSVRYGLFFSFKRGVQTLTDALADKLGDQLLLNTPVTAVSKTETGFEVALSNGQTRHADAVVLALAASKMAELVRGMSPELAGSLTQIPYGSTATVAYAWPRSAIPHALNGFGFVVPTIENRRVIASTWASKKFKGRAPDGYVLLRAFFGGDGRETELRQSDEELVEIGRHELRELLGVTAPPLFASVGRQTKAMPKYVVGHAARVAKIERQLDQYVGLQLAGNSLYGVGIPDSIRAGEEAVERLLRR